MGVRVIVGDALAVLRTLPSESVQCVVTSPPYFGLRAYGTDPVDWPDGWRGELGSEPTPALFIEHLCLIFDEVWRVMRPDATLWVNLGDSYSGSGKAPQGATGIVSSANVRMGGAINQNGRGVTWPGIPAKNLLLIPQRFAIAMQARGWIVRSEIVWAKTSAMPESVRDRPTSAWEPIWMFAKQARYFYDQESTRTPLSTRMPGTTIQETHHYGNGNGGNTGLSDYLAKFKGGEAAGANLRNVWTLGPSPFADAHFATFSPEIPRRCILAGSRKGDTVLDPFGGSGTTGLVADRLDRDAILIELNPAYADMARRRIEADAGPLLGDRVTVEAPHQASLFGEAV